ncbi:MAG: hypothetical protein IJ946_02990 [Clostridia bacterium]|nr:hypothetical protein [Clostridia bacterium]
MQYLLLICLVVFVAAQSIIKKQYNLKAQYPKVFFFSAVTAAAEVIFFAISSGFKFEFVPELIPYSVAFAAMFSAMLIGGFLSISWGPLSITMLIISYSLLIPTFYGLFKGETIGVTGIIGGILLLISLFLISIKKEKLNFSLKWLIAVIVTFVVNGLSSVILDIQPEKFDGKYKNEFMMMAMLLSCIILFVASLIKKEKITKEKCLCIAFGTINGISNALVNLLVMYLSSCIASVILFPVVSAGGIVLGFIMAIFVYKEKLSKMQTIGYFIGIASIVLLKI